MKTFTPPYITSLQKPREFEEGLLDISAERALIIWGRKTHRR